MRRLLVLLFMICIIICILAAVIDTAFASSPAREFAPPVHFGATATPPTVKQTPAQCVMVGFSKCHASDSPTLYAFHRGDIVKVKGQKWATQATVILYLIPVPDATATTAQSHAGNTASCPTPAALSASSIARSAQEKTDAHGDFAAQLKLPNTLKTNTLYNMCISVTTSDHPTSKLLFQLSVSTNSQQQTGGVVVPDNLTLTTGSVAPSSYMLSLIALALALIALTLFFFSSRQPALPHSNEKGNVL